MTLLQEIKQARSEYKRLLNLKPYAQSDISFEEIRVAKDKLGFLISEAKKEGDRKSVV